MRIKTLLQKIELVFPTATNQFHALTLDKFDQKLNLIVCVQNKYHTFLIDDNEVYLDNPELLIEKIQSKIGEIPCESL